MGKCRSCNADIVWVKTAATKSSPGKPMPLDADPERPGKALRVDGGNVVFTGQRDGSSNAWLVRVVGRGSGAYRSHFSTCPNARSHRKART